jgi:hypothetical protein
MMNVTLSPVSQLLQSKRALFQHSSQGPYPGVRFGGEGDGDSFKVSKPKVTESSKPAESKPKLAVFPSTGIKSESRKQFEELVVQLEHALDSSPLPVGINRYQSDQTFVLNGHPFTLSRKKISTSWNGGAGDYGYILKRTDGKQTILMGYQENYPQNYDTSPYIEFQSPSLPKGKIRLYDKDLVSVARQLCRNRFQVPDLLYEGRPVQLSETEINLLSGNWADQHEQLQQVLADFEKGVVVKSGSDSSEIMLHGQKYTLSQGKEDAGIIPYTLKNQDETFAAHVYVRNNYPQNYLQTPFFLCRLSNPSGGVRYKAETDDPEMVAQASRIFSQAFALPSLLETKTEKVTSPAIGYEIVADLERVAYTQGNSLLQMGPKFKVYAPLLIDKGEVQVPVGQEDTYPQQVRAAFQKAFYTIYEEYASQSNLGAAMALTAKYALNGQLPLEQVEPFWEAAIRYCNEYLKTKFTFDGEIEEDTFGDMITRNGIEAHISLEDPDPLTRLYGLMGEKAEGAPMVIPSGIPNAHPLNPVIQAPDPEALYQALQQYRSIGEFLDKVSNGSNDGVTAFANKLGDDLQTFGANYIRAYAGDAVATLKVVYRLLYEKKGLEMLAPIVTHREVMLDSMAAHDHRSLHPEVRGYQHEPNLAELLLSLNNPHLGANLEYADYITRAITSIEQHIRYGIRIRGNMVKQWARLGLLTHGFKPYKHDARGGEQSMFRQFGFERFKRPDEELGPGFLLTQASNPTALKDLDPQTVIEFRRGYVLASHPDRGTLLVRNSSLVFGRDLLWEPAYYSEKALTLKELKKLDSEEALKSWGFTRILDPKLYQSSKVDGFVQNLETLLDELFHVREAYSKWRFDPNGFDSEDNFTGDLTPGMRTLANFLENLLGEQALGMSEGALPALALFSPKTPPEHPFVFHDAMGNPHRSLSVSETLLEELQARLNGTWNDADYPHSMWSAFVQAAVDHQAEILLIDPPNTKQS